ncbi:MAG: ferredoxin-NADP reductase [Flavobacterium sp.]|jgi:ferredoxin-NADP reductase
MEEHVVKIVSVEPVTHDVMRFTVQKPEGYTFVSGQATDVSINTPDLYNEKRPFTFTSLNDNSDLEFIIKIYDNNDGVTKELGKLKQGDELIIHDVWGAIEYKGEGVFIAGGAGITPFIAILRQLQAENKIANNKLIFTNKTENDIILKKEFNDMLGKNFINTLTDEKKEGYENRRIDYTFLKEKIDNFKQHFYVCGPPQFVTAISEALTQLGAKTDEVIFEK